MDHPVWDETLVTVSYDTLYSSSGSEEVGEGWERGSGGLDHRCCCFYSSLLSKSLPCGVYGVWICPYQVDICESIEQ